MPRFDRGFAQEQGQDSLESSTPVDSRRAESNSQGVFFGHPEWTVGPFYL